MPMWTKAQQQAIYEPSGEGNILVSAAAGSGKTAVLVERIAEMVTRKENPVSIDNLLVVTFTEAAAAEMKERIINRISAAQRDAAAGGDTDKAKYLKEQMHLTASADINTIDSFCLSVVKNNFHILGVDPNFSIMDKNETDMLTDDTLGELFMALYESEDEAEKERFERLVKIYASNRDDEGLKSIVRKIYGFIQAFAEPLKWLHEKADMYDSDMTASVWVNGIFLMEHRDYITGSQERFWNELYDNMKEVAEREQENGDASAYWGKLWDNVCRCREAIGVLKKCKRYEEVYAFYKAYIEKKSFLGSAMNTPPKKKEAPDEVWQPFYDEYNYMRDVLREECMLLPTGELDSYNGYVHAEELKNSVDDLVWLVELFDAYYDIKKAKRNIKSFSDVEHLAYRLFAENENIRGEYAAKYTEILIDEYQDTNGLQDAIFTSISRGNKNMFMVGDLKQSIYKFRGGDPMIFKEKSRLYTNGEGGRKIMLSQNFRSRKEVLCGINTIFGQMMSDYVGDVEYTDEEALSRDEDRECYIDGDNLLCPDVVKHGYNSEFHNLAVFREDAEKGESDITAEKAEAACIAERIRELVDGHFLVHTGNGEYRGIEYRDIVILMRSVKSGDLVREMLEKQRIPAFVQKEEYFERREIKLMLSLISLINNHMQDIPLAAVMRSPIGGFTETELAKIKIMNRNGSFYRAVRSCIASKGEADEDKKLSYKCRRFMQSLDRWRGYVKRKSIASLIWTLYEETGFYDFMGALEGGEEAQANLKLLYERAKRYEASGFKGIFNFIRYIERMESRSDDISGAQLINESHNVVRIMTIHKSKGLEFPVVFLARTAKSFMANIPGSEERVRLHPTLGIGVDYYNYEDMYCKKLMFNKYIKEVSDREKRSEELRLLYVAMTRAREKLIVVASKLYKNEDEYSSYLSRYNTWSRLTNMRESDSAKTYSDWISSAISHDSTGWIRFERHVSSLEYEDKERERETLMLDNPEAVREAVGRILEFTYKYPESGSIPAKTSVTAIKEMADEENVSKVSRHEDDPVYMTQKPAFMRGEKTGAEIGTAHHQVMAYINIEEMIALKENEYEDFVRSETERIAAEGQLDAKIAGDKKITDAICENVCGFFRSAMGKAVFEAKNVYRERPFEIEITAREYNGELGAEYDGERVMVQGIIDLYFEDKNGDIILVDYKTDRCKTEEEQKAVGERYRKQLELYERAMEKILKRNVKEKYLYLFSARNVLKLN